jgi:hypothetical protein
VLKQHYNAEIENAERKKAKQQLTKGVTMK